MDGLQDIEAARQELLQQLTAQAQTLFMGSRVTKKELSRYLGTSTSQLNRLFDPLNTNKSVDAMVCLIMALGGTVDVGFDA